MCKICGVYGIRSGTNIDFVAYLVPKMVPDMVPTMEPDMIPNVIKYGVHSQFDYDSKNRLKILCKEPV